MYHIEFQESGLLPRERLLTEGPDKLSHQELLSILLRTGNKNKPVYGISTLKEKLEGQEIQTAILTVPSVKSQEVADLLVEAGIKGILSFSPVHLTVPKDVVVQYVDLTSELQTLLYFMRKNS